MAEGKDTPEEKRLIREALLGGPEGKVAFVALAKKKEGPLRGLLMPLLKNEEDVKDVFWFALQKAWAAFETPNPPLDFHSYLVTTALNRARNLTSSLFWKRARERVKKEKQDKRDAKAVLEKGGEVPEEADLYHLTPEAAYARAEEIDKIKKATFKTFEKEPLVRQILDYKYRLEMDYLEIAATVGISQREVATLLQDAKRRMLPVLRKELGIDDPAVILHVVPDPEGKE